MNRSFDRRDFLKFSAASFALAAAGCAPTPKARVVVVGGGYGGATAAKYLRLWNPAVEVVLVERANIFTSCPMSNLVLAGYTDMETIRHSYDGLRKYGVQIVFDEATAIDPAKRIVRLERGGDLGWDRLIVAPGIGFLFDEIAGYEAAMKEGRVLHAWTAGAQTLALRQQLERMRDGGVVVIGIPPVAYRCPPGPYERACLIAAYLKQAKPRSKVVVLDANPDVISKTGLFKRAWEDLYKGTIEYRGSAKVVAVDAKAGVVRLEVGEDVKGDVLNIIPPQRAGDLVVKAGLVPPKGRWCEVDWMTAESRIAKGVHVIGDATLSAPGMPKSGSMANQQGKLAAWAISALLDNRAPDPAPKIVNTCYSMVSRTEAIRVSSVHEWDAAQKTLVPVKGAGGVSSARNELEGRYAWAWAHAIWADTLG